MHCRRQNLSRNVLRRHIYHRFCTKLVCNKFQLSARQQYHYAFMPVFDRRRR
jgi:hypothetical protein